MTIYNSDGSEAGACGNATRCVASLLLKNKPSVKISTMFVPNDVYDFMLFIN